MIPSLLDGTRKIIFTSVVRNQLTSWQQNLRHTIEVKPPRFLARIPHWISAHTGTLGDKVNDSLTKQTN